MERGKGVDGGKVERKKKKNGLEIPRNYTEQKTQKASQRHKMNRLNYTLSTSIVSAAHNVAHSYSEKRKFPIQ